MLSPVTHRHPKVQGKPTARIGSGVTQVIEKEHSIQCRIKFPNKGASKFIVWALLDSRNESAAARGDGPTKSSYLASSYVQACAFLLVSILDFLCLFPLLCPSRVVNKPFSHIMHARAPTFFSQENKTKICTVELWGQATHSDRFNP